MAATSQKAASQTTRSFLQPPTMNRMIQGNPRMSTRMDVHVLAHSALYGDEDNFESRHANEIRERVPRVVSRLRSR